MIQLTPQKRQLLMRTVTRRETSLLIFTLVLIVAVSIHSPRFLSVTNFNDILLNGAILAIASIGQMMVVITGGIDLSVGSGLALSGMLVGLIYKYDYGLNPLLALLLGALIGIALGSVNGVLVSKAGVPPIIASLGTMSIYRGLIFIVSKGQWVNAHEMPDSFIRLARGHILGIPNLIFMTIFFYVAFYYFLTHLKTGREIYAVGGNAEAARVAGISVDRIKYAVYAMSGFLYGLCGVLWVSRFASAQSDSATGFEFSTVTAIVIGGVSVFGGTGKITGVLLGAVLISIVENALAVTQVSPFWKLAIQGFIILLAVTVDAVMKNRDRKTVIRGRQV
ncbi:MAG: ABC transporter permease [Limnochordia bacterium]|jgi:rhamnose transport system permease protein|nr:ABC transporter permease [Bacillota bacterium]HOB08574.1 ABC transporter permease [Limnochordia bacterium]HPT92722.1 ABC transporter permease [Limnochordia bacterium]HPZ30715.1 ABC transporter permease [Limnochordia bacterium]HQD70541.1 ABC transporter permease [Limnochordia bacterium]